MTETKDARAKIISYMEESKEKISDLAVIFNVSKAYMGNVLNGKQIEPADNELILTIINAFKIR